MKMKAKENVPTSPSHGYEEIYDVGLHLCYLSLYSSWEKEIWFLALSPTVWVISDKLLN